jgi:hypothetical protein
MGCRPAELVRGLRARNHPKRSVIDGFAPKLARSLLHDMIETIETISCKSRVEEEILS